MTDMMSQWNHKDEWRRRGNDFMVTVTRHSEEPSKIDREEGPHRWAVYAYVYPAHPHFAKFNGDRLIQDAAMELPLHGGASLLVYHYDQHGTVTSIQVGADYNHLWDDYYTHCANADAALSVLSDAKELYAWLDRQYIATSQPPSVA